MKIVVCKDREEMSQKACDLVLQAMATEKQPLVSFPGGDTPKGMIQNFVKCVNTGKVDIQNTRFVSLDEWVGLKATDAGSCGHFLNENLFAPMEKNFLESYVLNGAAEDIQAEKKAHQDFFDAHGPLTVSVLGIGMNGHLGFNESGVDFSLNSHIIPLDEVTKTVMVKYFGDTQKPEFGITQGINQIMQAGMVILIADGAHKAEIIQKAVQGEVSQAVPASVLQNHPNCYVVVDAAAAARL